MTSDSEHHSALERLMPEIQAGRHQTTNNRVLVTKPNTLIDAIKTNDVGAIQAFESVCPTEYQRFSPLIAFLAAEQWDECLKVAIQIQNVPLIKWFLTKTVIHRRGIDDIKTMKAFESVCPTEYKTIRRLIGFLAEEQWDECFEVAIQIKNVPLIKWFLTMESRMTTQHMISIINNRHVLEPHVLEHVLNCHPQCDWDHVVQHVAGRNSKGTAMIIDHVVQHHEKSIRSWERIAYNLLSAHQFGRSHLRLLKLCLRHNVHPLIHFGSTTPLTKAIEFLDVEMLKTILEHKDVLISPDSVQSALKVLIIETQHLLPSEREDHHAIYDCMANAGFTLNMEHNTWNSGVPYDLSQHEYDKICEKVQAYVEKHQLMQQYNNLVPKRTYSYTTLDQYSIDELQAMIFIEKYKKLAPDSTHTDATLAALSIDELQAMVDGHPANQDFDAILAENS